MTFSDYLLDSILILLVVRQVRESRLDRRAVILPLGIVAFVAHSYLHTIPTSGNDIALIAGLTGLGITLGVVGALFTRVRSDGGRYPLVKAGWISAGLWVTSMGARMVFSIWANSHNGGISLYHFSAQHHLDITVWTAALVLMALGEVISRVGLLALRGHLAMTASQPKGQLVTV